MKRLILLGASGSIGTQTIDVIKEHSDELELVGVSVGRNVDYLVKLLNEFQIKYAYTIEENKDLTAMFPGTRFFYGSEGLQAMPSCRITICWSTLWSALSALSRH